MSLPELPEGMEWKIYDWNNDKFVGIFPKEGYVWGIPSPFKDTTEHVSAYSWRLKSKTQDSVLKACAKLYASCFDGTLIFPPAVKLYEPEEEDSEDYTIPLRALIPQDG